MDMIRKNFEALGLRRVCDTPTHVGITALAIREENLAL